MNFDQFIIKTMMIKGLAGADANHFECAIKLMELGFVDAKKIITNVIKLESIIDGFNMLISKNDGVVKVVVNP